MEDTGCSADTGATWGNGNLAVKNAFGTLGNGNPYTMVTGFDPASIATNLGSVVAAKLASTLVSQVVIPHYQEGAVGQQIGASVGAARRGQETFLERFVAKTERHCGAHRAMSGLTVIRSKQACHCLSRSRATPRLLAISSRPGAAAAKWAKIELISGRAT